MNVNQITMKKEVHATTGLHVLVFKTSIAEPKDLLRAGAILAAVPGILNWSVDTEDIDKVLRVESTTLNTQTIINVLSQAGYCCEELPD